VSVSHDGRRWSNADQDRVDLVEYDATWPGRFEAEARALRAALAGLDVGAFDLQHVGSTAIPGVAAKPIIDILLISDEPARWPALIEPIGTLGYVFWADNPRRDRLFFVKGMPPFGERRTHHVHVRTSPDARATLLFRDHLRRHPDAVARYAALKRDLSARYPTDRDAYTEGKGSFVDEIVRGAEASAGGH